MEKEKVIWFVPLMMFLFGIYNVYDEFFYNGAVKEIHPEHIPYWIAFFWTIVIGTIILFHYLLYINSVMKQIRRVLFWSGLFWVTYYVYRVVVCFSGKESDLLGSFVWYSWIVYFVIMLLILMPYELGKRNKNT